LQSLAAAGVLAAAAVVTLPTAAGADGPSLLPIVFVHGAAGSGAQYETQSRRFDSNGYPATYVRAFEYDSSFATNTLAQVIQRLGTFVDDLRGEFGVAQVNLVGHSLGTTVSNSFLANVAQTAKIAHYVGIDGASNANCGVGNANLSCMGIWQGTNTTGNVGGNNVRLSP
jgi:triacylglycerol esterase/lipase EstA (alpha/beta hydrolase family)